MERSVSSRFFLGTCFIDLEKKNQPRFRVEDAFFNDTRLGSSKVFLDDLMEIVGRM